MASSTTPIVLELAPLPRDQVGPFLLLGIDKTADKEKVEASWARRVIWARKDQMNVALEDINWAKEVLTDQAKRIRADAASLNLDTANRVLAKLTGRYGPDLPAAARCQPIDVEKDLAGYEPAVEVPDIASYRQAIAIPDIPEEFPAVAKIVEDWLREPLDPWNLPAT